MLVRGPERETTALLVFFLFINKCCEKLVNNTIVDHFRNNTIVDHSSMVLGLLDECRF